MALPGTPMWDLLPIWGAIGPTQRRALPQALQMHFTCFLGYLRSEVSQLLSTPTHYHSNFLEGNMGKGQKQCHSCGVWEPKLSGKLWGMAKNSTPPETQQKVASENPASATTSRGLCFGTSCLVWFFVFVILWLCWVLGDYLFSSCLLCLFLQSQDPAFAWFCVFWFYFVLLHVGGGPAASDCVVSLWCDCPCFLSAFYLLVVLLIFVLYSKTCFSSSSSSLFILLVCVVVSCIFSFWASFSGNSCCLLLQGIASDYLTLQPFLVDFSLGSSRFFFVCCD